MLTVTLGHGTCRPQLLLPWPRRRGSPAPCWVAERTEIKECVRQSTRLSWGGRGCRWEPAQGGFVSALPSTPPARCLGPNSPLSYLFQLSKASCRKASEERTRRGHKARPASRSPPAGVLRPGGLCGGLCVSAGTWEGRRCPPLPAASRCKGTSLLAGSPRLHFGQP